MLACIPKRICSKRRDETRGAIQHVRYDIASHRSRPKVKSETKELHDSLTHPLTHSLTHPLTHSLTDSLTHSRIHSPTDSLAGLFIGRRFFPPGQEVFNSGGAGAFFISLSLPFSFVSSLSLSLPPFLLAQFPSGSLAYSLCNQLTSSVVALML